MHNPREREEEALWNDLSKKDGSCVRRRGSRMSVNRYK